MVVGTLGSLKVGKNFEEVEVEVEVEGEVEGGVEGEVEVEGGGRLVWQRARRRRSMWCSKNMSGRSS